MLAPEACSVLLQRLRQHQGMRPDPVLRQRVEQALEGLSHEQPQALETRLARLLPGCAEWQDFLDRVLVPETWFRRDAGALAALAAAIGPPPPSTPLRVLRVLCAPCSTGEEPISIALMLRDLGWPDEAFSLHAIDLSQTSIDAAEGGHYRSQAFRGVDPAWREHHFSADAEGRHWQLRRPVPATSLRFERINVFDLHGRSSPWDVVFCRNLLIYLETEPRLRLLEHLRRLCRDNGLLFVGHAETGLLHDAGLAPLATPMSFGFHNRLRAATRKVVPVVPVAPTPAAVAPKSQRPATPPTPTRSAQAAGAPFCPDRQDALALADRGRLAEACTLVESCLRKNAGCADAHALAGDLHLASDRLDAAHASLQKALYLRPAHADAARAMLALACRRGNTAAIDHWRARVLRNPAPGDGAASAGAGARP